MVTALALSMCAMVAVSANARDGGSALIGALPAPSSSAQVEQARAGAVEVATDAMQVAQSVQAEAAQVAIDASQLQALEAATAHLDELLAVATAEVDRGAATSRSADREEVTGMEGTSVAAEEPAAAATSTPTPAADPDPASVFEQTPAAVPTIPPTTGEEDATTAELREAVAAVATATATAKESAEAKKAADVAAAAAAAQAAADAAAAAQAAAEAEAATRAAWKQSLLGYSNGKIPDSALCGVSFDSSVRLRCDAAEQLDILNAAFRAKFGTNLTISDSYRSYAGQVLCKRTKGYLCATPGTSNHGTGVAVDLGGGIETFGTKQYRWMTANAPALNWTHPSWAESGGSKPEAWHWEYTD
ncbi:hypothetical protein ASE38_02815 [Cellulomonas sp. Root930]|nr:hypothetical protein ASE38_02815 [Cellulomonas sp. Root930]